MTKKKEWFAKLCAFIRSFLFFRFKSSLFLLTCFVPTLVSASMITTISCLGSLVILLSCCIFAPIFCLRSFTVLLSCHMFALIFCFEFSTVLIFYYLRTLSASVAIFLSCHNFVSCCNILALLLPLPLLSLPFLLGSLFFQTFK